MSGRNKILYDPYAEMLNLFNRHGVKYVIVGMSGINYYASNAQETFSTQDFDVFIKPTVSNVKKAALIFRQKGYTLCADEKEVDDSHWKEIVRRKNTITASDPYGITFDLILNVSGYTFSRMAEDAVIFNVGKVPIKVGKLKKMLMSKKIAGRKKDLLFLKRFEVLLKGMK